MSSKPVKPSFSLHWIASLPFVGSALAITASALQQSDAHGTQLAEAAGVFIGLLLGSLFFAYLGWWIGWRSRTLATVAFCVLMVSSTIAHLDSVRSSGMAMKSVLETSLACGPSPDSACQQRALDQLRRSRPRAFGRRGRVMRAGNAYVELLLERRVEYDRGLEDSSAIWDLCAMQEHAHLASARATIDTKIEQNDALRRLTESSEQTLQELAREHGVELTEQELAEFRAGSDTQQAVHSLRMASLVLHSYQDLLRFLDRNHGGWHCDDDGNQIFATQRQVDGFNSRVQSLTSLVERQTELVKSNRASL